MGCDRHGSSSRKWRHDFNPRTHVGCDPVLAVYKKDPTHISIHAPTWGATQPTNQYAVGLTFQSTHPRGVRHYGQHVCNSTAIFQSTHPRGVRRAGGGGDETTSRISIHAPTWGATCITAYLFDLAKISIHAPTWGATPVQRHGHTVRRISIHAPTWGATGKLSLYFIFFLFQSTHPRGVRLGSLCFYYGCFAYFNPRTHVGCDLIAFGIGLQVVKFQSTHPRGVRRT